MRHEIFVDGVLVELWDDTVRMHTDFRTNPDTVRAYTAAENAAADARAAERTSQVNEATLLAKASTALANNATYLGLSSPTNAQNLAQIRSLTRQMNALIKLTLRDLDDVAGT